MKNMKKTLTAPTKDLLQTSLRAFFKRSSALSTERPLLGSVFRIAQMCSGCRSSTSASRKRPSSNDAKKVRLRLRAGAAPPGKEGNRTSTCLDFQGLPTDPQFLALFTSDALTPLHLTSLTILLAQKGPALPTYYSIK